MAVASPSPFAEALGLAPTTTTIIQYVPPNQFTQYVPAGTQYGAPPGTQYGAPSGGQYGAPSGAQYGAQYGAPSGGQYGAQYGAPYGLGLGQGQGQVDYLGWQQQQELQRQQVELQRQQEDWQERQRLALAVDAVAAGRPQSVLVSTDEARRRALAQAGLTAALRGRDPGLVAITDLQLIPLQRVPLPPPPTPIPTPTAAAPVVVAIAQQGQARAQAQTAQAQAEVAQAQAQVQVAQAQVAQVQAATARAQSPAAARVAVGVGQAIGVVGRTFVGAPAAAAPGVQAGQRLGAVQFAAQDLPRSKLTKEQDDYFAGIVAWYTCMIGVLDLPDKLQATCRGFDVDDDSIAVTESMLECLLLWLSETGRNNIKPMFFTFPLHAKWMSPPLRAIVYGRAGNPDQAYVIPFTWRYSPDRRLATEQVTPEVDALRAGYQQFLSNLFGLMWRALRSRQFGQHRNADFARYVDTALSAMAPELMTVRVLEARILAIAAIFQTAGVFFNTARFIEPANRFRAIIDQAILALIARYTYLGHP